jgi:serine protease
MNPPFGAARRGLALVALFVLGVGAGAPEARAAEPATVDAVVVRFRGDAVPGDATALPPSHVAELARAMRITVVAQDRTRDGAFRLSIVPSLPFVEARDAINRVRLRSDVLYASLAPAHQATPPSRVPPKAGSPDPLLHRLIVKYRDPGLEQAASLNLPLGPGQLDRIAALAGQPVANERVMSGDAYVVRLFNRVSREEAEAIADALSQDTSVAWAQPDYLDQIALAPNDPSYASQWHYFEAVGGVNLPAAWNRTTGSASIRVGVIDTGSLPNHPDLAGKFVGGYDMIASFPIPGNDGNGRDADPSDPGDWVVANECGTGSTARSSSWHGTHVTGTIAALTNNGLGVAGVNWASPIVPIRVLGKCGGYSSDIADGITWASGGSVPGAPVNAYPAHVLNLSLGGYRSSATCDAVYDTAISGALSRNVVVVVAAGNANQEAKFHTPGNCNGVITVAATGRNGQRASYSNYDDNDGSGTQVEIAAPGGSDGYGVLSTLNSGTTSPDPSGYNYVNYQGTSMATPHVAGIVSLMLSVAPATTPSQILSAIQTTARAFPAGTGRDCTSNLASVTTAVKYCGAGIIDADAAIAAVSSLPATTTTLASSANPSTFGQSVTFTASVTGTNPTGSVAFSAGGTPITGCGTIALAGAGNTRTAQCSTSALAVGSRSIVATYGGDAGNAGSVSSPLTQTVNKANSTTGIASSANPSVYGTTVTFTATVSAVTPTGTVAFAADGGTISGCGAVSLTGTGNVRTAQCSTSALAAGARNIVATYAGDANNNGSASSTLPQTVNKAASTTGLASSANPSAVGATVTFTASVTGVSPTGTVGFTDNGGTMPGCGAVALSGSGSTRTAQCATASLPAGNRNIVATYGGDAGNNGSVSTTLVQSIVATSATTTTLASSENPSVAGSPVTFTATVTGNSPSGAVAFTDGGTGIAGCGAVALAGAGSTRTASCTASGLAVGNHPIVATYGGDGVNAGSASSPLAQAVAPPVLAKQRDFDGTLTADLLWRNSAGGHAIWLMSGSTPAASANLGIDPPRAVSHAADFDGNGRHDLLIRDAGTGATSIQLMDGLVPAGTATLLADAAWEVTHTGDFDGDGKADLVWRNDTTGTTSMWRMNGTAFVAGSTLLVNAAWKVTHVADFDGDGKADLVWRNATTGETAIWLMNGTAFASGSVVLANPAWSVVLTGDLDGNGKADLVWRNASTGEVAIWLMNGFTMSAGAIVLADASWTPTHAADFTGDGRADLVWRNATAGATSLWLMNGLTMTSGGSVTNPGSTVAAIGDYNADGRADLVWHDPATGVTEMWLMDRLAPISKATLLVSTWWTVRP